MATSSRFCSSNLFSLRYNFHFEIMARDTYLSRICGIGKNMIGLAFNLPQILLKFSVGLNNFFLPFRAFNQLCSESEISAFFE